MGHLSCGARAPGGVGRSDGYRRREPRTTVLYQTVEQQWPVFRERAAETGGLPRFVEREFEEYLRCGVLEWRCLHLACRKLRALSAGRSELQTPRVLPIVLGPPHGGKRRAFGA